MKSLRINQNTAKVNSRFADLDNVVAQSPWQAQTVNELMLNDDNSHHQELAVLAPTLAELSQQGRWIVLIGASKQAINDINQMPGLNSDRVLLVHPQDQTDCLWAIEQALMSGNSSAVLGWPGDISPRDRKRLQLASKRTSALAFVFSKKVNLSSSLELSFDKPFGANHSFH